MNKAQIIFATVLRRELQRFWSIKRQTIIGPALETFLYISVFGAALGSRIRIIDGSPYILFIIPGLLMMAVSMNAFSNNASSLIQQKFQRSIEDQLTSPIANPMLMAAYTLGGLIRGLVIVAITFITASLIIHVPVAHPFLLIVSLFLSGLLFASIGVWVGLRAETFDNVSFYQTFILQPLTFLGGIFYSSSLLPEPYRTITHFNPIFYMINTVRYGMIGHADVNPYISLGVIFVATAAMVGINTRLFATGYRLRS